MNDFVIINHNLYMSIFLLLLIVFKDDLFHRLVKLIKKKRSSDNINVQIVGCSLLMIES